MLRSGVLQCGLLCSGGLLEPVLLCGELLVRLLLDDLGSLLPSGGGCLLLVPRAVMGLCVVQGCVQPADRVLACPATRLSLGRSVEPGVLLHGGQLGERG